MRRTQCHTLKKLTPMYKERRKRRVERGWRAIELRDKCNEVT